MISKSLQAWVLHKQWSGETSVRVCFFTKELGLIHCLYKGGRMPKKQAFLQAFTPLWVSIKERYGYYYVQTVENIAPMLHLEGQSLFCGLYINELLYHAMGTALPDSILFDGYLSTLKTLVSHVDKVSLEAALRRFEWQLLKNCGYAFSFTHEANTNIAIIPDSHYHFEAGTGFIRAKTGIPGNHILALSTDSLTNSELLLSAKHIMRRAIDHLLGGRTLLARDLYKNPRPDS